MLASHDPESLQESARQIWATPGRREERKCEVKHASKLRKSMNNPHQTKRLDHWKHKKATPGRAHLLWKDLGSISSIQVGGRCGIMEERGGKCFTAKIKGLLSLCPAAMEKVQQLRVSKCVAATYGCKQGCLTCSRTLREPDRGSFHVSLSASFFTDVNFQSFLLVWLVKHK